MNIVNVASKFVLQVDSEIEQYRVDTFHTKEPETLNWIENEIHDGDIIYDVGANIGIYSLYIASRYPDCKVYSFEPFWSNYSKLVINASLNGFNNLFPVLLALSDTSGLADFYVKDETVGSSGHQLFENRDEWGNVFDFKKKYSILTLPMHKLTSEFNLEQPTHIKIDVDGHEQSIVKGLAPMIAQQEISSILIEINHTSSNFSEIDRILTSGNLCKDNHYNTLENHSRVRRASTIYKDVENIIYTRAS